MTPVKEPPPLTATQLRDCLSKVEGARASPDALVKSLRDFIGGQEATMQNAARALGILQGALTPEQHAACARDVRRVEHVATLARLFVLVLDHAGYATSLTWSMTTPAAALAIRSTDAVVELLREIEREAARKALAGTAEAK